MANEGNIPPIFKKYNGKNLNSLLGIARVFNSAGERAPDKAKFKRDNPKPKPTIVATEVEATSPSIMTVNVKPLDTGATKANSPSKTKGFGIKKMVGSMIKRFTQKSKNSTSYQPAAYNKTNEKGKGSSIV